MLTGLHNVRFLTEYVAEKCSKADVSLVQRKGHSNGATPHSAVIDSVRKEDAFALLCLDLDSFKPINDNFGHQKGDEVLRDLGQIFLSLVRSIDVVARYGGDEFLIVLSESGQEEAQTMLHRIKKAVEGYDTGLIHPRLGALRLGVSVGFACFPHDGTDCGTLLSVADAHMYEDKAERKLGSLIDRAQFKPTMHSTDPLSQEEAHRAVSIAA